MKSRERVIAAVPILAFIVAGAVMLGNWIVFFEHASDMTLRCGLIVAIATGSIAYVLAQLFTFSWSNEKRPRKRWPNDRF